MTKTYGSLEPKERLPEYVLLSFPGSDRNLGLITGASEIRALLLDRICAQLRSILTPSHVAYRQECFAIPANNLSLTFRKVA